MEQIKTKTKTISEVADLVLKSRLAIDALSIFGILSAIVLVLFFFLPSSYFLTVVYLAVAILSSIISKMAFEVDHDFLGLGFGLQVLIWVRLAFIRALIDNVGAVQHITESQILTYEGFLSNGWINAANVIVLLFSMACFFIEMRKIHRHYKVNSL